MRHQIAKVCHNHDSIEGIYAIKLAKGDSLSIDTIITYIDMGLSYFYIDSEGKERPIEAVELLYKPSYIRTADFVGKHDPLLALPTF